MPRVTESPALPLIEIVIADPLTVAALPTIGRLIDDAVALRPEHLVLDLTACDYLDAAGIALLLDAHRRTRATGGRLTLHGLSPRLYRILQIARVDRVLPITAAPPSHQPRHRTLVALALTSRDRTAQTAPAAEGTATTS